jgi:hypothetical protein
VGLEVQPYATTAWKSFAFSVEETPKTHAIVKAIQMRNTLAGAQQQPRKTYHALYVIAEDENHAVTCYAGVSFRGRF